MCTKVRWIREDGSQWICEDISICCIFIRFRFKSCLEKRHDAKYISGGGETLCESEPVLFLLVRYQGSTWDSLLWLSWGSEEVGTIRRRKKPIDTKGILKPKKEWSGTCLLNEGWRVDRSRSATSVAIKIIGFWSRSTIKWLSVYFRSIMSTNGIIHFANIFCEDQKRLVYNVNWSYKNVSSSLIHVLR